MAAAAGGVAHAQNYPAGPMRIISPYPPGGGTDILARALSQRLAERFGQNVIVDNRPGANGTIGSGVAAKSPPDGLTMVVVAAGFAAGASLYKKLPYDQAKDLAPVTLLASGPLVLVVHPSLPVKNVEDLVALARSRPRELNVGSSGVGSLPHLSAELFSTMSGISMVHVPYKGPGAALVDVLSGQVSVYFINILGALPYVKDGRLRALGVTSPRRSAVAPALPAIAEAGLGGFDMTNWYGLLVTAGTPRESIGRLYQEVARIMALPALKEQMAAGGMTPVAGTPEEFQQFLAAEAAKYAKVIAAAGIKPE
jgi:tripartite-type tricarboxylate transporter receptor subunit TctC